jgi:ATP-dependent DNA helicase RecG
MFLGELRKPVTVLHGVGKKSTERLARLGVRHIADLLRLLPRQWEDRSRLVPIVRAGDARPALTVVEIVAHDWFGKPHNQTLKVFVQDETSVAVLLCFNRNFLAGKLPVGARILLYAPLQHRFGELQAASFDFVPAGKYPLTRKEDYLSEVPKISGRGGIGSILPVYPLTEGLTQGALRDLMQQAMEGFGKFVDDELPEAIRRDHGLPHLAEALVMIHRPRRIEEPEEGRKALAFNELFHLQCAVTRRGALRKRKERPSLALETGLVDRCIRDLPFSLTADQKQAVEEIIEDLKRPYPMARLLQGDVGSGKTLTALLSALPIIEAGYQVAFMAPTELLARQHAENSARILAPLGVRIALFTGSIPSPARKELLVALQEGEIDLVVGTHTLFSSSVRFRRLRYCIIDEQHKFGVMQRQGLLDKGEFPDLLTMTATPIPRTMALTAFGDLAVSVIRTMPPGRKPIITHLAKVENRPKVYAAVEKELERGGQAYFVYPLIEEGSREKIDSAESMYRLLREEVFPQRRIALLHSRIDEEIKEREMGRFLSGELDILVATSVVEVGVDAPNASCMVIEHAEQFGLSALHQLRGRVGRSDRQSYCFLVFSEGLTETGKQRLRIMKENNDGFVIAEEDLKLRGPGELSGMRQAGVLNLQFADLLKDGEILEASRKEATAIVSGDFELEHADHQVLKRLYTVAPPFDDLVSIASEG